MFSVEQQAMWQRAEAELSRRMEGLLVSLVGACDRIEPTLEKAMGGWGNASAVEQGYQVTLERARALLAQMNEHRAKFKEERAVPEEQRRPAPRPHGGSFESLQHGTNWRDMKGNR